MTRTFTETNDLIDRFAAELESALLAQALAATGGLPDERTKALMGLWVLGTFNATAHGLDGLARELLEWEWDGDGHHLFWHTPSGIACPLARLYRQENGTWAALIVVGVRYGLIEAMAAAEWGVSRLTTG